MKHFQFRPEHDQYRLDETAAANDWTALTPEQQRVRDLHLHPPRRSWLARHLEHVCIVGGIAVVAWFLWQYAVCVMRGAC